MRVEDNGIYRVQYVADLLDVSRSTVYRTIEAGDLEVLRVGKGKGQLRIKGYSLNAWLDACSERGAAPIPADATAADSTEVA